MTVADLFRQANDEQLAVMITHVALQAASQADYFKDIPEEAVCAYHLDWLRSDVGKSGGDANEAD